MLATHGSLLVTAQLARDKAANLLKAMESNREIGVAMGILMHRHRLDREQAFAVLRVASQDSNRKLAEVASEVADTGILEIRRWPAAAGGGCRPPADARQVPSSVTCRIRGVPFVEWVRTRHYGRVRTT